MIRLLACALMCATTLASPAAFAQAPSRAAPQPKANIDKMDNSIKKYQDATRHYQAGQFKLAEKELEEFLGRVGEHAGGNFMMGLVQIELQNMDKARTSFRTAVKLDPSMVAPRGYLGAIEAFSGNMPGAAERKTALEKMKTDCAGACPKAGEIDMALERVTQNMAAAAQPQPS
jgi:predicted Zn-dependent protease